MNTSDIKLLIAALRSETRQDSISPESLGSILEKIVERMAQLSSISPLDRIDTLPSVDDLSDMPTKEEMQTLYIIEGYLYAYTEKGWKECGQLRGPQGEKGDPGTYIDPANVEIIKSLNDLDGKTTSQKQAMIPDGNTVEEIISKAGTESMEIQKSLLPMLTGNNHADVGVTTVSTSKVIITSGVVVSSTASGYTNFRVVYVVQPFHKGDIYYRHAENGSSSSGNIKRLIFGWTQTDPSSLSSIIGLELSHIYDKNAAIQDVYMQCPYDTGYLVFFYYSHSSAWQSAANIITIWRNSLKDKQDPISYDNTPALNSTNPVTSDGIYKSISAIEKQISGQLTPIEIMENHCIDWNGSFTTNGSWRSGYANANTYIFDVSELRGQIIKCHFWNRANTYPYAFVKDYKGIKNQTSAETNGWTENAILRPTSRDSSSGAEYNKTFTVPEEASHLLLVGCPLDNIPTVTARCLESRITDLETGDSAATDIITLNPTREFLPKIKNMVHQYYSGSWQTVPLLLVHFSDVHGNGTAISRMIQWCNQYSSYIDDIIHTGDAVSGKFADGVNFWYSVQGAEKILNVMGNHDHSSTGDGSGGKDPVEVYQQFIAPYADIWGVTQPEEAAANGYTWWYKDYASKSVRLIAMDCMQRNATQLAWLKETLVDAAEKGLTVVIGYHSGPSSDYIKVECPFSGYIMGGVNSYNWPSAVNAVKDFKNGVLEGQTTPGNFACWLCGHTHKDYVLWIADSQLVIGIDGLTTGISGRNRIISTADKSQDCFNLVAIDTYRQTVKLLRVGNNIDDQMRHISQCAISYIDGKVISY